MRGQKSVWALILLMGGMALLISLGLFYNMGVFVDEFGLTPAQVCGGEGWLLLDWARLALLLGVCVCALCGLFWTKKK